MSDVFPPEGFWTAATAAFEYRTITFNFSDPGIPGALRPVIQVALFLPPHLPRQCASHKPTVDWCAYISGCAAVISTHHVMLTRTCLPHRRNPTLLLNCLVTEPCSVTPG